MVKATTKDVKRARWIREFNKVNGYSPNVREFGEACGFSSTSTASKALNRLARLGLITIESIPARRVIKVGDSV